MMAARSSTCGVAATAGRGMTSRLAAASWHTAWVSAGCVLL
jgi:hypothetical protein